MHLAEQADEAIKSSYNLEFLGVNQPIIELELENELLRKLVNPHFLIQLWVRNVLLCSGVNDDVGGA